MFYYTYFHRYLQGAVFFSALILLSFSALAQDIQRPEPEMGTGLQEKSAARGVSFMVSTAHPEATRIGEAVLARGGTAADAAVAIQMVLGLVEPQSSGIGGGAFALYYDAAKGQLVSVDGREAAPEAASHYLFRGADGKPMKFMDAVVGGRSVGVPGVLRLLEKLHSWYGSEEWSGLFTPAIKMAENGFTVTPRLAKMVANDKQYLGTYTDTKLYFFPDVVNPIEVGRTLRNPKYAITLRQIAQNGVGQFYEGSIAQEIVKAVRETARDNPGLLSMEDLQSYEAKERAPVCGSYRGYKICSMGEPSSGGLTLLSILGMLEYHNLRTLGPGNPVSWHLIGEASRLAFADRNYYMADPDFVRTPGMALIDRGYLKSRSQLLSPNVAIDEAKRGMPPGWSDDAPQVPDVYPKPPGTSHISIVDSYGNILSMTTTIEGAFGSKLMTEGFLLNNQLTDFSFSGGAANSPDGGKRPRSSMAPTIVFDPNNRPFLVIGSAGGSRIIGFVAQRIIAMIDWQMELQEALNMKNVVNRGKGMELESGVEHLQAPLAKYDHPVTIEEMTSGFTGIHFKDGTIIGAADPRREGVAKGR